jgi:hypothetical protein
MKKIIAIIVMMAAVNIGFSQVGLFSRVIVKDSLQLQGIWYKSFPFITPSNTTNKYFTGYKTWGSLNDTVRAVLSFAAGSGAYNQTTGVITIPTNNNQITNGAGYVTAASSPVTSVFGRTGAVVAASGDYTFAQINSKPTTIGGYGITDFNSLGDARWSLLAHNHTLDGLSNVTITSKATGDLIKWNGSAWVNFVPTYISSFTETDPTAVHIAGTETITGYKTVSNNFNVSGGNKYQYAGVGIAYGSIAYNSWFFANAGNLTLTGSNSQPLIVLRVCIGITYIL